MDDTDPRRECHLVNEWQSEEDCTARELKPLILSNHFEQNGTGSPKPGVEDRSADVVSEFQDSQQSQQPFVQPPITEVTQPTRAENFTSTLSTLKIKRVSSSTGIYCIYFTIQESVHMNLAIVVLLPYIKFRI